jgi:hypothetical protein
MCVGLGQWEVDKVEKFLRKPKAFSKKAWNFEGWFVY